jgi:hypothetical protein
MYEPFNTNVPKKHRFVDFPSMVAAKGGGSWSRAGCVTAESIEWPLPCELRDHTLTHNDTNPKR